MAPKQRVSHVSPQHKKQLDTLATAKQHIIESLAKKRKRTPQQQEIKPAGKATCIPEPIYSPFSTLFFRPFEARLPTRDEAAEIRKENMKLNDGYYRQRDIFLDK